MRASAIVMHNPLPQNSPQVLFAQRDHPVQALAPHASDQSFAVGMAFGACTGVRSIFSPNACDYRKLGPCATGLFEGCGVPSAANARDGLGVGGAAAGDSAVGVHDLV